MMTLLLQTQDRHPEPIVGIVLGLMIIGFGIYLPMQAYTWIRKKMRKRRKVNHA